MKITFNYEGAEVIDLDIPNNTKSIEFDLCENTSHIYDGIHVNIPSVKRIEFYERSREKSMERAH